MLNLNIEVVYFVLKWRSFQAGYKFGYAPSGFVNKQQFYTGNDLYGNMRLCIPMDPITAISMNLVTPEELNFPPGVINAFKLLDGPPT